MNAADTLTHTLIREVFQVMELLQVMWFHVELGDTINSLITSIVKIVHNMMLYHALCCVAFTLTLVATQE